MSRAATFAGLAKRAPGVRHGALRLGFDLQPGMTVGLYGGSFNPAHEGHAHVAETAMTQLGLDRVIWLVSPQNPLKSNHETAPLAERLAGAARMAKGPGMIISDAESRIGAQYTLDTVTFLRARFPRVHFVWIMGADSLASFHRWKGWTQIMRTLPVAVVSRPWAALKARGSPTARRFAAARHPAREGPILARMTAPAWVYLRGPFNFASSTALRERLRQGDR
ncbi:nicotinate-nucleotide adenylyltransferase [Caulobacter ginsengisoli]|uniref:Probable nicotinate-nucleotide adenylyltransferase n=1 Tax=Caulobacter ginsengisoli TaxID=400775 RepID=A0ABU0IWC3_9CAUL|nr:nicotinate-nucleotide adenylyltransferase [Caulobacter ginsengisoli]